MSLFGDLPPPSAHLRPKNDSRDQDEYKPKPLEAPPEQAEEEGQADDGDEADDRPDKRRRVEGSGDGRDGGLSSEQVTAALRKIASHISNPDKFPKASGLLRQLLESGALRAAAHREPLFQAIKAAFSDFDAASEPGLRRDYMKLAHSLDKWAEGLLSKPQLAQLSVYRIVGFTQNEMHTDDSFVFNKVGPGREGRWGRGPGAGAAGGAAVGSVWTAAQTLVMRRQALIECLITSRGFHKTPWARTSVELLVEHFARHRDRFAGQQQLAVDEMVRFVRAARAARPTGPSQKEINRDTTSFDRARSEWSRATVSTRGKVGAQGDAKTQNWLG
ncbi:hypothetical protein GPECTOR_65g177 [Gonium pectorale]|uniref:Uncharacterized protein n=1 Tax=Gonium pectorale TaxID=33097 RepID=A0A150G3U9_GONPE|nr:hypothetical protein GPECTOR_65g177 [Gonium pectorale]|eukprot:KXZ44559.1 hypothetical protein GPECTOR_65g177 [Gonium pectorale]